LAGSKKVVEHVLMVLEFLMLTDCVNEMKL